MNSYHQIGESMLRVLQASTRNRVLGFSLNIEYHKRYYSWICSQSAQPTWYGDIHLRLGYQPNNTPWLLCKRLGFSADSGGESASNQGKWLGTRMAYQEYLDRARVRSAPPSHPTLPVTTFWTFDPVRLLAGHRQDLHRMGRREATLNQLKGSDQVPTMKWCWTDPATADHDDKLWAWAEHELGLSYA